MGDGLEQGRTEITSCYHRGLKEGGGQWFQDGTRPNTTLLLTTACRYFALLKRTRKKYQKRGHFVATPEQNGLLDLLLHLLT